MAEHTITAPLPPMRMSVATGAWALAGFIASGSATTSAPNGELIPVALITLASTVLVAIIGPLATAWSRDRFNRSSHRTEQKALNDHLIDELDNIRRENENLREENARLRRRR